MELEEFIEVSDANKGFYLDVDLMTYWGLSFALSSLFEDSSALFHIIILRLLL